ncbi:polysaccharide pyruvyl transferase family protein [Algibacter amylolyticus]|uniref:Polysaccharide pyruvyl transferase family protein n=1 Tax=Algibacter amylolyticus TaxID=1608400 RepID=A0A5M7B118_9FLAO|nr:polysaccharide pyruvyl transferase family protein [Algibacter amylolyticus]KAA5822450.1 polysaccharide pyruvyl transferase family protein [Algibacter amylolyticus]MBB5269173.1 polysaccharide pyruvyl transferase WcaK-like protein [Algibacter amylolyticus]TSJ73600.1 polysaccharide pyruvyl transferase family protein [Algibacter amylolyticus]
MIKIAHFGTFDVDNYGDLLFPHIAEFRLPNHDWEHISPTDNITVFKDGKPIISFDKAKNRTYNAVVVGGGNILHLLPNIITVYNNKKGFAYANLWVGAAKIAIKQKIPYLFNAPGISKNFKGYLQKKIATKTFSNSNYVAFREGFSRQIAINIAKVNLNFKNDIAVVPDSAFDIDKLWPLDAKKDSNYITVNLNSRYHSPINDTAKNLDALSEKLKMPIKFIIIGDCHGDRAFTKKVSKLMETKHDILVSDGLKKIAHVIGNGNYFFGSSMHGFITALSYGVPAFLVLRNKPLHKFKGLLELTELKNLVICDSFYVALNSIKEPAILTKNVKLKIESALNRHWENINKIIQNNEKPGFSLYILKFEKLLSLSNKFNRVLNKFKQI